jgi:hypothetical protein
VTSACDLCNLTSLSNIISEYAVRGLTLNWIACASGLNAALLLRSVPVPEAEGRPV